MWDTWVVQLLKVLRIILKIILLNPVNPRVSKLAEKLDFKLVNTLSDLIAKEPEIVVLTTPANITLDLIPE